MQIHQAKQYISCYFLYKPERHSFLFVLIMLDQIKKIRTHQLEHTAHVFAMNTIMHEVISE